MIKSNELFIYKPSIQYLANEAAYCKKINTSKVIRPCACCVSKRKSNEGLNKIRNFILFFYFYFKHLNYYPYGKSLPIFVVFFPYSFILYFFFSYILFRFFLYLIILNTCIVPKKKDENKIRNSKACPLKYA